MNLEGRFFEEVHMVIFKSVSIRFGIMKQLCVFPIHYSKYEENALWVAISFFPRHILSNKKFVCVVRIPSSNLHICSFYQYHSLHDEIPFERTLATLFSMQPPLEVKPSRHLKPPLEEIWGLEKAASSSKRPCNKIIK